MAKKIETKLKSPTGVTYVSLGGRSVECVSISLLAKYCGVKAETLRRYERAGVFPKANLRIPSKSPIASKGNRLYTKELALAVGELFIKIKQGSTIPIEVKQGIAQAFKDEREKYLNKEKP